MVTFPAFWKHHFWSQTAVATFWATFGKNALFLFEHLITLLMTEAFVFNVKAMLPKWVQQKIAFCDVISLCDVIIVVTKFVTDLVGRQNYCGCKFCKWLMYCFQSYKCYTIVNKNCGFHNKGNFLVITNLESWVIIVACSLAKPRVSLTAPNCNHFVQVSLTVLDFFGCNCQS